MISIQRRSVVGHIHVSHSGFPNHPGVFCGIPKSETDAGTILTDHDRFLPHSS
jgi:hypothetical protein